jgi:hypothetical protein
VNGDDGGFRTSCPICGNKLVRDDEKGEIVCPTCGFVTEAPADVGLDMEAMAAGGLFGTEDLGEGISAFLGKRKPEFKGK